uniref:PNPLA domain-containing protein n=1 Tax=Spumella elongata TaxID=89044 RepID=A0A7S3M752_9STRA
MANSSSTSQQGLPRKPLEPTGMLHRVLSGEDYALALTPGFFGFYGHIGVLKALEETNCLRPSHVSGSSAGALVGGFLSAGMTPEEMIKAVLEIKRADIWDVGGVGGLLKGELFEQLIERNLPVQRIEECKYPLAVTTYDLMRFKTLHLTEGKLAQAMRASCTFPGMFQPVMIEGSPNIDGGVFDNVGLMALPHALGLHKSQSVNDCTECQESASDKTRMQLVVNIVFGRSSVASSVLPPQLKNHKLLTVVVENIPSVHPFSMDTMGVEAYKAARAATLKALHSSHMQEFSANHWCCYIDAQGIDVEDFPLPTPTSPLSRERLRDSTRLRVQQDQARTTGSTGKETDNSSAESALIDHSWSTATGRRSNKRKRNVNISNNNSDVNETEDSAEQDGEAGEEESSRKKKITNQEDEGNSDTEENSRVSRRGFMSIPSFSFLNGTYKFYDAALEELHRIEDASSVLYHDASTALQSASKRLNASSKVLYEAVRDTLETVTNDFGVGEASEDEEEAPIVPVTPRRAARLNSSSSLTNLSATTTSNTAADTTVTVSVRKSRRSSAIQVEEAPVDDVQDIKPRSKTAPSAKKVRSSKRS